MEIFIILAVLAVILLVWFIVLYNSIIRAKNSVLESFSAIDTVLQNRYDLIPNLVEVVKKYAAHETAIFEKVSEMRANLLSQWWENASKNRFEQENQLQAWLKSIFAIAENYPDLKASANFLNLQEQWSELEDRLQAARRAYNSALKNLRDKKETFPSNMVAKSMSLPTFDFFEAETAAKAKLNAKDLF